MSRMNASLCIRRFPLTLSILPLCSRRLTSTTGHTVRAVSRGNNANESELRDMLNELQLRRQQPRQQQLLTADKETQQVVPA